MPVLFAISVLCLCAVIWSAVSVARHLTKTRRRRRPNQQRERLTEIFFEDKMQQIREHAMAARQTAASQLQPIQWTPAFAGTGRSEVRQAPVVRTAPPQPVPVAADLSLRKGPQPAIAHNGNFRADWDYFHKDLGDLTDPYEITPLESTGTRSSGRR